MAICASPLQASACYLQGLFQKWSMYLPCQKSQKGGGRTYSEQSQYLADGDDILHHLCPKLGDLLLLTWSERGAIQGICFQKLAFTRHAAFSMHQLGSEGGTRIEYEVVSFGRLQKPCGVFEGGVKLAWHILPASCNYH